MIRMRIVALIALACTACTITTEVPVTTATAGHQVFVNLVPKSRGDSALTVKLTIHVAGKRPTRTLTLPMTVSSPISVLPLPEAIT